MIESVLWMPGWTNAQTPTSVPSYKLTLEPSVVGSGRNSNSFKLLCMSLLPARMKMIQSKMKRLEWSHHCSYYKCMFFPDAQGKLTPQSMIGFWPNFELIRTLMVFLITCKNQEDPIKMKALEF